MPGGTFRKSLTSKTVTLQESALHRDRKKQILASPHGCPWSLVLGSWSLVLGPWSLVRCCVVPSPVSNPRLISAFAVVVPPVSQAKPQRTKGQGPRTTDNCPIGVKPYAEDPGRLGDRHRPGRTQSPQAGARTESGRGCGRGLRLHRIREDLEPARRRPRGTGSRGARHVHRSQ